MSIPFGAVTVEHAMLGLSVLLLLGVLASKAADRVGVPALLLFLGLGMLAGSEGPGGVYFDDAPVAQAVGVVALALILYSGGLDTDWASVRPVLRHGLALSTVRVAVTALVVGLAAKSFLGFSLLKGVPLGSIVSSTDAAAVFAVLRSRAVNLRGRLKPLLEFESGSNDPMAVFLTVGLLQLMTRPAASVADLAVGFALQMPLGALVGYAEDGPPYSSSTGYTWGTRGSTRSSPCPWPCSPTASPTLSRGTGSSRSTWPASSSATGRSSTGGPCCGSTTGSPG
ncbi:MAG TPA: cation:proton antiporter [Gemmataceae bacterium]|nr:cation:proton antiporter [Gemmataceae bacterium]